MAQRRGSSKSGTTVAQLQRGLDSGKVDPVYFVVGSEDFLRRKAIEAIVAAVVGEEDPGMAIERLDGETASLSEILDAARSLPLFLAVGEGPAKVVIVRSFDPAAISDVGPLEEYLTAPVDATCLVLEAASVDARRAAAKLLGRSATRIACEPPEREAEVRRWIETQARAHGFEIEPEALAYLLEMVGVDLQQLHQELEKVALFVGDSQRLEARDLESLLGRSREHSVFELTDALVAGRNSDALRVLNRLLDDGEEPVRILAMVSWIVRQLIIAQDLSARGCPERELLGQLGGRWDQRRVVLDKARRSDGSTLEELLVACSRADSGVKMQRGAGGRGILEGLCRQVCAV